jgi:hypothetical protein
MNLSLRGALATRQSRARYPRILEIAASLPLPIGEPSSTGTGCHREEQSEETISWTEDIRDCRVASAPRNDSFIPGGSGRPRPNRNARSTSQCAGMAGTSGFESARMKPFRFGMTTLGRLFASSTVSSGTIPFSDNTYAETA